MSPACRDNSPWRRAKTAAELARLGARIALRLRPGDAVCLWGPLGAGKSTLARGLIRALAGPDEDVPSPTFTLVQTYDTPGLAIAHFDLYRLTRADEAFELGLDEALATGAAVVEWPERLGDDLPPDRLDIGLRFADQDATHGREVRVCSRGSWIERVREFGLQADF